MLRPGNREQRPGKKDNDTEKRTTAQKSGDNDPEKGQRPGNLETTI